MTTSSSLTPLSINAGTRNSYVTGVPVLRARAALTSPIGPSVAPFIANPVSGLIFPLFLIHHPDRLSMATLVRS